ncbi:unnamed protein product, partial [marine sediment metagenome]
LPQGLNTTQSQLNLECKYYTAYEFTGDVVYRTLVILSGKEPGR